MPEQADQSKRRFVLIAAIFATLAVVVGVLVYGHFRLTRIESLLPTGRAASEASAGRVYLTVTAGPIRQTAILEGHIAPAHAQNVPAPFGGRVDKLMFTYDSPVAEGQILLALTSSDIQSQLLEARSAYLSADQRYQKVLHWKQGTEVQAAQRAIDAAKEAMSDAQRKADETKMLYAKGIASRDEYRASIASLDDQERGLQSAQANLVATLEQGSETTLESARLQLEAARIKLDTLKATSEAAVVKAPFSGVAVMPYLGQGQGTGADRSSQPRQLEVGALVSGGDPLLGIADLATYSVAAEVDEIEVGKLRVGQPVKVTGEGFPSIVLTGQVSRIAEQAVDDRGGEGLVKFKVWVEISELDAAQRQQVRMGMSAQVEIVTYANDQAILLPVAAVHGEPGNSWVYLQSLGGEMAKRVPVDTGIATADGIEVKRGLSSGDRVLVGTP